MKNGIHPENYRLVVFKDMSNDEMFLCKSTADTKDTIEYGIRNFFKSGCVLICF